MDILNIYDIVCFAKKKNNKKNSQIHIYCALCIYYTNDIIITCMYNDVHKQFYIDIYTYNFFNYNNIIVTYTVFTCIIISLSQCIMLIDISIYAE